MASTRLFEMAPPFPTDVTVANIAKISLAKLAEGDEAEIRAVFAACKDLGFFMLDLRSSVTGEKMIDEIDQIFEITSATMKLSAEEKKKFRVVPPHNFLGYKAQGLMKTETGQPDRCEMWALSAEEFTGKDIQRDHPAPINTGKTILKTYIEHGQYVVELILSALATALGLPGTAFLDFHPPSKPSGTIMRLLRYPPSVTKEEMRTGLVGHTDFGSVTLLANVLGGLQVLAPEAEPDAVGAWLWIRPEPGCLIVNIGDVMVEWTGGVLRSNMHRVSYSPGDQHMIERLSFALLVRPEKNASMRRLEGGQIPSLKKDQDEATNGVNCDGLGDAGMADVTAWEWEQRKRMALIEGKDIARSRGGRAPKAVTAAA